VPLRGAGTSGLIRHARTATGSIAGGGTGTVTISFSSFADANYTATLVVEEPNGELTARAVTARTSNSVTVLMANLNALTAREGTVHLFAIHD
jgi:hypothetical protein